MRTVASCAYSQYDQHAGEPHPQTAKQCFIVAISKQHTLPSFQAMHSYSTFELLWTLLSQLRSRNLESPGHSGILYVLSKRDTRQSLSKSGTVGTYNYVSIHPKICMNVLS